MPPLGLLDVPNADEMELHPPEEHVAFRQAVRAYLDDRAQHHRSDHRRPPGTDPSEAARHEAAWQAADRALGLADLCIPGRLGGADAGVRIATLVVEEFAYALAPGAFLTTGLLAPRMLVSLGGPAADGRLRQMVESRRTATVALPQPGGTRGRPPRAERDGNGRWQVTGEAQHVLDGAQARLLLVPAVTAHGPTVFAVDQAAPGVNRTPLTTLDPTRPQASVTLAQAPATVLGQVGQGDVVAAHVRELGAVAMAADQLGVAQRSLDLSVEFAKVRRQFGRPIGSFQSIKHACADMLVDVECARSTVLFAGWTAEQRPDALAVAASIAKAYADDVACRASATCIQVHGAIGYTWEHDAHLLYRRARSSALLFGDRGFHLDRLASVLGMS